MHIEDTKEYLGKMDEYFRALNYLSFAQLYLKDNPLLERPLVFSDIKEKLVGHWGTVPGQNFIYTHLNRVINKYDLNMIYIEGPGHGGQVVVTNTYLEGSYSEVYRNITEDKEGLKKLCKQFSYPGGIGSHATPETPGSIHEGGELGYSLSHAFGAVFDNPDLIAACVIGDGEAETGPLATSWHGNKFLNPKTDGVVLPILHLNGYKIANPTIFGRMNEKEILSFFQGCGWDPILVNVTDKSMEEAHLLMSKALDGCIEKIKEIQKIANEGNLGEYHFPMLIFASLKGWTGPKEVDGKRIEGSFRAHQIPIEITKEHPESLKRLELLLRSYHPEELFDAKGRLRKDLKELVPKGNRRMGANPHANGGLLLKNLRVPNFRDYKVEVPYPGAVLAQDMRVLGSYVRDLIDFNKKERNFRIFGPDEALSNRLNEVFEVTNRQWESTILPTDEFLSQDGRVLDSYLSEHMCEGWLEGYLLTGRYGFMHSYESFIRVVDSMTSQHAKWLKMSKEIPWRRDIASLNYVLSSHVWQQDHNGYTHQDPGFINHILTKKADTVRIYLPADANCLLSCFDHVIQTKNYINLIIASKHPSKQWLSMDEAVKHCTRGLGIWGFASNDKGSEPDVVMASCGDTPTIEILAAITILRQNFPNLKIRMVNVVDLMRLESKEKHPHGLSDLEYDMIFTTDKPIIFAFHGYANVIHELTYKRANHHMHVSGYMEEGTITTPFDMRVQNKIDRYHLVMQVLKYVPNLGKNSAYLMQECVDKLIEHKAYIKDHGVDMPEIANWDFITEIRKVKKDF